MKQLFTPIETVVPWLCCNGYNCYGTLVTKAVVRL